MKKRFIFPCCMVCMCSSPVLLASPDDLDEITIRVIEGDELNFEVHNLELPVFVNDESHNKGDHDKENNNNRDESLDDDSYRSDDHLDDVEEPDEPEEPEEPEEPDEPDEPDEPEDDDHDDDHSDERS